MQSKSKIQTLFVIFFSFAILIGLFLFFIPAVKGAGSPIAIGGATLSAILCIYCSMFRLLPGRVSRSVEAFQTDMIISLAFAEMVMLLGTFLGGSPSGPMPFALVTWGLMFGFILPKLLLFSRLQ
jgi:hypothetical protein